MNRLLKIVVFFPLFAIVATGYAWAVDITRDGKPLAEIVVAKDAPKAINLAAEDLQTYVEKMSGAKLSIVPAPSKNLYPIYVGQNQYTDALGYELPAFTNSGYDILIRNKYAVLSGPFVPGIDNVEALGIHYDADVGTWYAVDALLERWGVRFYAPYDDGTIIPQLTTLSLEPGRETSQAAYERRHWHLGSAIKTAANVAWLKHMKCGIRTPIYCNSNIPLYTEKADLHAEHPSWYAQEAPGKPLFGSYIYKYSWIPRYSDPGFQQASAQWLDEYFDKNPHLMQSTMGAPDGTGNPFDYRDVEKYQKPGISHWQAYANMLWDYHAAVGRELEKTHPDKYLIWWCLYNNSIPTNIDPATQPHNILVRTRAIPASSYAIQEKRDQFFKATKAMYAAFKPRSKTLQWEWFRDYAYPQLPAYPEFYMHALQRVRQEQRQYYDGFFCEAEPPAGADRTRIGPVANLHLMMYVNSKLMWNPDLDLDALLDEYYHLWFGPAAAEMKAFHKYAEEVWSRPGSRSVSTVNGFLKEQDIPVYFRLLDAAKAKTKPGSLYYNRIDEMEKSYAGLKTLFKDRTPTGQEIQTSVLSNDATVDGDLTKYKGPWQTLTSQQDDQVAKQNQTQFTVALTQDRTRLFVAVRCQEPNMKGLLENTKSLEERAKEVDPRTRIVPHSSDFEENNILKDDHVEIDINTPERNWFTLAVNPLAIVRQVSYDIEIINRDALPTFWRVATQAHVNKFADHWEVELMIPTEDFGDTAPSSHHPWGMNVRRVRMAGGQPDHQAFTASKPSQWARLVWNNAAAR